MRPSQAEEQPENTKGKKKVPMMLYN